MKRISILALLCTLVATTWAIPARRGARTITQADGTEITVYQHGDEYFHWMTNEQGQWIEQNQEGQFQIVPALTTEQINAKRNASPRKQVRDKQRAYPLNIAPKGLIILVNFTDLEFQTSKEEMDSMHIAVQYQRDYSYEYRNKTYHVQSEGSVRQYFHDVSNGQYNPEFDVVGPVTVSKNMAYYGGNTNGGSDKYPEKMVKEACELVDNEVDFSEYDNDGDGYVDFVYVVYAGYGEADGADANTIWPHSYYVKSGAGYDCYLDGKTIDLYACGNELDFYTNQHTGIGTFCHEFSHVLGLPDLYTTNGATHHTSFDWDIMDYGPYNNDGNTPPTYSAYERFFMGWLEPRVLVEPENVVLDELQKSNTALLISMTDEHNLKGNDPMPTTFYMLENRQQTLWDKHLPGHGMMLTKIDYSYNRWWNNEVNNYANSMGVDIIEAKENTGDWGKKTDLFPAGMTSYLRISGRTIESITETDGVIRFKYKGGVEEEETDVDNIITDGEIIAIYNILGQKQTTTQVAELEKGTYVIVTTKGNKKIVR